MWRMSEILRQIFQFFYIHCLKLFFSPEPKIAEMLDLQDGMEEQKFGRRFSIKNPMVVFETHLDQGWMRGGHQGWMRGGHQGWMGCNLDSTPKMTFILELKSTKFLFSKISVKARLRLVDVQVMEPTKLIISINFSWNNNSLCSPVERLFKAPKTYKVHFDKRVVTWHHQRNNNQPEIWEKELFKCWDGSAEVKQGTSFWRPETCFVKLNHLIFDVDLSLFVGLQPATSLPPPEINDARLSSDWAEVFSNGREADVVVVSPDGQEFPAHRLVLSTRSPVFCAMLKQAMKETEEGKIYITDFSAAVIQEFLHFIYTGRLVEEETSLDAHSQEVLSIANKYDVAGLKQKTELFLAGNLNVETALELLSLGDAHQAETLTAAFIRQHNIGFFMMGERGSRLAREKPHLLDLMFK